MSKSITRGPWLRLLGVLNALALAVLLSQPASAEGVDACTGSEPGCSCIIDSGTPFLPDGCYDDSNPGMRCQLGEDCTDPN